MNDTEERRVGFWHTAWGVVAIVIIVVLAIAVGAAVLTIPGGHTTETHTTRTN